MAAPKELFKQKVNVSPVLAKSYVKNFEFHTRNLVNKHLLTTEDLGKTFEHQERTFTIHGMTENEHMIVTENIDGRIVYWECTTYFVQMKLERFYCIWQKVNGITITVPKEYDVNRLYLPNHKASRRKKVSEEELPEDEPIMETYVEDTVENELEIED
jgi:hypothetical protein